MTIYAEISTLQGQFANLQQIAEDQAVQLTSLLSQLNLLRQDVNTNAFELESVKSNLLALADQITINRDEVLQIQASLEVNLAEQQSELDAFQDQVTQTEIATQAQLDQLANAIQQTNSAILSESDVNDLIASNALVNGLQSDVISILTVQTDLNNTVNLLSTRVTATETSLGDVNQTLSELDGRLATAEISIVDIDARLVALEDPGTEEPPVPEPPPSGVVTSNLALGGGHSCVILNDSSVKCWGADAADQLGDGTGKINRNVPVPLRGEGLTNVTQISANAGHTCAVLNDSSVRCWGSNLDGQGGTILGAGGTTSASIPTRFSNIKQVGTGGGHTCVVRNSGSVNCVGQNVFGQIGNGTFGQDVESPAFVPGISNPVQVTGGELHSCVLLDDSSIKCWGLGSTVGNGGSDFRVPTPVGVIGITNAVQVASGPISRHTCALLNDGTINCWGSNSEGQLGNGTRSNSSTPVIVSDITDAIQISVGGNSSCALLNDGTIHCWGRVAAQGGQRSLTPILTPNISGATEVQVGNGHACAYFANDTIQCWGDNNFGQLGNGTFDRSNDPTFVVGFGG